MIILGGYVACLLIPAWDLDGDSLTVVLFSGVAFIGAMFLLALALQKFLPFLCLKMCILLKVFNSFFFKNMPG